MEERIKQIKQAQAKLVELQTFIHQEIESLERETEEFFRKRWESAFPGVKVEWLPSLGVGSETSHWDPKFYIYNIERLVPTDMGWTACQDAKIYAHTFSPCQAPVDQTKLNLFIEEFSQETRLSIELVTKTVVRGEGISCLKAPDDIIATNPGIEILQTSKVWSVGWDIPDSYVIGKQPTGRIEIWYSTNGHGFGYNIQVETEEELRDFFFYLSQNHPDETPLLSQEEILDSWKRSGD